MLTRRHFIATSSAALFSAPLAAQAQSSKWATWDAQVTPADYDPATTNPWGLHPRLLPTQVSHKEGLTPGDIHVDAVARYLYHIGDDGTAMRYGVAIAKGDLYEPGTYTIRLTAENECGTDVATQDITLVLPVTPVITASVTEGCTPLTVEFSAGPEGEGQTYLWQFTGGDPVTSTDPNVSVTYTTPGVFDVSLTIANAAGSETTTEVGLISVGQGPEAAFTVDNTLGSADISLTNNSSFADSYEWFFGDGNMSTATEPYL